MKCGSRRNVEWDCQMPRCGKAPAMHDTSCWECTHNVTLQNPTLGACSPRRLRFTHSGRVAPMTRRESTVDSVSWFPLRFFPLKQFRLNRANGMLKADIFILSKLFSLHVHNADNTRSHTQRVRYIESTSRRAAMGVGSRPDMLMISVQFQLLAII